MTARAALACLLVALPVLNGCSGYRPAPPAFHEMLNVPYALDAGDQVRVTVYDQPELTGLYSVGQTGHVAFPLIGPVPARGRTVQELARAIAQKLRGGFLRDPDVSVEVDRYRPVFIMGEVSAGGQYSFVPGMTAQTAIASAGGFTPRANQGTVDITRQIDGRIITGRVPLSDPLRPGDTVVVRERLF